METVGVTEVINTNNPECIVIVSPPAMQGPRGIQGLPGALSLNVEAPLLFDNTTNTLSLDSDDVLVNGGNF